MQVKCRWRFTGRKNVYIINRESWKTWWQQCRQTGCNYQRIIESNLNVIQNNGPYQRSCKICKTMLFCNVGLLWIEQFVLEYYPGWWVQLLSTTVLQTSKLGELIKQYDTSWTSQWHYITSWNIMPNILFIWHWSFYNILFQIGILCQPSYMSPCGVTIDLFNKVDSLIVFFSMNFHP